MIWWICIMMIINIIINNNLIIQNDWNVLRLIALKCIALHWSDWDVDLSDLKRFGLLLLSLFIIIIIIITCYVLLFVLKWFEDWKFSHSNWL